MKKFFLLFLNLTLIIIILFIIEFIVYTKEYSIVNSSFPENISETEYSFFYPYHTNTEKRFLEHYNKILTNQLLGIESGFRPVLSGKSQNAKKLIILFGCSYTYGASLNENQTFSYKLNQKTGKTIYNRAYSGWGIQHMLFQLNNKEFKSSWNVDDAKNVEHIIYTFIDDHIRRLYEPCAFFDDALLLYKKNNKTKLLKRNNFDNIYWNFYYTRKIHKKSILKKVSQYDDNVMDFLLYHFIESNNTIKEIFKNAKFTIFVFDGDEKIKQLDNKLTQEGINIIYLSDISNVNFKDKEYISDKAGHPSETAWDIIVPILIKKLKL